MKEIIAAAVLVILIAVSVWNISYLSDAVEKALEYIDSAEKLAIKGKFDESAEVIHQAAEYWGSLSPYTHILLRHPEIESCTDAFYELHSEVSGGNYSRAKGAFGKVRVHLTGFVEMERLSLGSVF